MSESIVNDVTIQIATINGTGSQSANLILMRSIFNMGVPVSAKNLFPSNIAGLPTWYTVRAHHKGYQAGKKDRNYMIVMNPNTVYDDIRGLQAGATLIYDTGMKIDHALREDHTNYGVPFSQLVSEATDNAKLKKKVINMLYVGVVAQLLSIEEAAVQKAVAKQFKGKDKIVAMNQKAIDIGYQWAADNLEKKDPYLLESMGDATEDKILIEGNDAAALGALMGGCTFLSWYPITPSSSVCENLIHYFNKFRMNKTNGVANFASIQAEDEIAAMGMVLGAGWAGARAMTATSGPGISLMAELAGYAYYAEIPSVIFDIQRMGPSTGLPTRTSQGDLTFAHYLSHGDTQHPVLLPGSVEECYTMGQQAFDLAEQFQSLVFVLSDLDLGMNTWMADPFTYPEKGFERGKVLDAEALEKVESFARYADIDGDGVPYRTLPGTAHAKAPYFTRGSGHNAQAKYSEKPEDWKAGLDRINYKMETIRKYLPEPILNIGDESEVGIIAFGSSDAAMMEALDMLKEEGLQPDYLRIRALPFQEEVLNFLESHERIYVVEQNRDAQMRQMLSANYPTLAPRLRSILNYDGSFLDAQSIAKPFLTAEQAKEPAHV